MCSCIFNWICDIFQNSQKQTKIDKSNLEKNKILKILNKKLKNQSFDPK